MIDFDEPLSQDINMEVSPHDIIMRKYGLTSLVMGLTDDPSTWKCEPYNPDILKVDYRKIEFACHKIPEYEAMITKRRLREHALGKDNGWLEEMDAKINELRALL